MELDYVTLCSLTQRLAVTIYTVATQQVQNQSFSMCCASFLISVMNRQNKLLTSDAAINDNGWVK